MNAHLILTFDRGSCNSFLLHSSNFFPLTTHLAIIQENRFDIGLHDFNLYLYLSISNKCDRIMRALGVNWNEMFERISYFLERKIDIHMLEFWQHRHYSQNCQTPLGGDEERKDLKGWSIWMACDYLNQI